MTENSILKPYDLEDRTFEFAKSTMGFCKEVGRSLVNGEVVRQLIRAAGSVGANFIEANESLSKKDFLMRVKICRKEAKESRYWLRLLDIEDGPVDIRRDELMREAQELVKIFASIILKSK